VALIPQLAQGDFPPYELKILEATRRNRGGGSPSGCLLLGPIGQIQRSSKYMTFRQIMNCGGRIVELISFKAEPSLIVILDQLVSRDIFISRSALIRFALWNKLASDVIDDFEKLEDEEIAQQAEENKQILRDLVLHASRSY